MVRFIVLWKTTPTDVSAFERHYREVHTPLAWKLAGLRRYTLSRNASVVRGQDPHHRIAELDWDDMASLRRAPVGSCYPTIVGTTHRKATISPTCRDDSWRFGASTRGSWRFCATALDDLTVRFCCVGFSAGRPRAACGGSTQTWLC